MKQIQKYNPNTILLIAGIAILVFVLLRNKQQALPSGEPVPQATYSNKEEWEIEWSSDGLPLRVIVHRDARVV